MRTMLALLALPLLAGCSPSERAEELDEANQPNAVPEAVSAEALSAWTIQVADSAGGPSAFQMVVDDEDLSINTASEGIAWRPVDQVLGGEFEVSARFEPSDVASTQGDVYGIIVGGRNLSDPDRSYAFFLVRPNGEHLIGRREGTEVQTLLDWEGVAGAGAGAAGARDTEQQLSVRVVGEQVEFLLGETVVATFPRNEVQPHGLAGIHVGADAKVEVRDWQVSEKQVQKEVAP